jgi:hypothetical protein
MIEFLTNLSEILKLIILILCQTGCILILISLPFIIYYGSQNTDKEEKTILRITIKDKERKD